MSALLILGSARKRGHSDEDILHALSHRVEVVKQDDGMIMVIGPARDGQLLEVGIVKANDFAGELVAHCMKARTKYLGRRRKGG